MFDLVKYRWIPFIFSGILVLSSFILLATIGLKQGIDFTGGSQLELAFTKNRPTVVQMRQTLNPLHLSGLVVQPAGTDSYILRMGFITEDEHQLILNTLNKAFAKSATAQAHLTSKSKPHFTITDQNGNPVSTKMIQVVPVVVSSTDKIASGAVVSASSTSIVSTGNQIVEKQLETIGPSISANLRKRSIYAGIAVVVAIIIFVAYAFRKVSKPVQSWKYGVAAIIALIHDVSITMGVFVLLGKFLNVEVNIPFVVALLTILGYSVNDTIVVFDRIREQLIKHGSDKFEYVVNLGVNQTFVRSLNTSLTTLFVLIALFFFGGETIHYFALALIIGIFFGTYSSIFLASPLLVVWERLALRKRS